MFVFSFLGSLISAALLIVVLLALTWALDKGIHLAAETFGLDAAVEAALSSVIWLLGIYATARGAFGQFGISTDGWLGWTSLILVVIVFWTSRDTFQDWASGYTLRNEAGPGVGDRIVWRDTAYQIEAMDLRVVRLRTDDGATVRVPNRLFAADAVTVTA